MPLTVMDVRNAKADERDFKLFDSAGLYLLVTRGGGRSWRFKYRYAGKEKLLTFGLYPEVTMAAAREQRDKARALLREGKDPAAEADKLKRALIATAGTTFKSVGDAWFEDELPGWSTSHAKRVRFRLEKDIYPQFGKLPISEIDSRTILTALRRIEGRGSIETAKRVRGYVMAIFERAIGECLVDTEVNPAIRIAKSVDRRRSGNPSPCGISARKTFNKPRGDRGAIGTDRTPFARYFALSAAVYTDYTGGPASALIYTDSSL